MNFVQQAWYWRLAVLRVVVYMAIIASGTFLTATEDFSSSQWDETGQFLKLRIYLSCAGAAGMVFISFMDNTMGELRKAHADAGKTITTLTSETKGPNA